jgi:hypothetical protein
VRQRVKELLGVQVELVVFEKCANLD